MLGRLLTGPGPFAGFASAMGAVLLTALVACSGDDAPPGVPRPPSAVTIEGPLPDLRTPVPPGQGELGRIILVWQDNAANELGFRIYQECEGRVATLLDVPSNETRYGPLQTCRPGRLGVAAYNSSGFSTITWAP
jgi:hypothetical protein